jgi:hypothetical protein
VTRFWHATGWLGLFVFVVPVLGFSVLLLWSRVRPTAMFAAYYGGFLVVWFLVAVGIVAISWVLPPLVRAAGATAVVYLVALVLPFTSTMARYPLHVLRCGHLPLVGTTFAAGFTYKAPGSPTYAVTPLDTHLFCTREEAAAKGFHEIRG